MHVEKRWLSGINWILSGIQLRQQLARIPTFGELFNICRSGMSRGVGAAGRWPPLHTWSLWALVPVLPCYLRCRVNPWVSKGWAGEGADAEEGWPCPWHNFGDRSYEKMLWSHQEQSCLLAMWPTVSHLNHWEPQFYYWSTIYNNYQSGLLNM